MNTRARKKLGEKQVAKCRIHVIIKLIRVCHSKTARFGYFIWLDHFYKEVSNWQAGQN